MTIAPTFVGEGLRILDFDIETRLVGFYEAGRFKPKGCEPIAIACSWESSKNVAVWTLTPDATKYHESMQSMLDGFLGFYNDADVVTGHYVLKFDLPILTSIMFERGMVPLGEKLVSDTKNHLVNFEGLSKSQENLSEMLELAEDKFHMNDPRWRDVTRLLPEGLVYARDRVTWDIKQHKAMRAALLELGYLNPPELWKP